MVVEVPPYQISHVHYAGNSHLNIMENQFIKELLLLHLDELISFKISCLETTNIHYIIKNVLNFSFG